MSSHKEKPLSNGNITKSVDPSLSTTLRLAMPVILLNLTFAAMQATDAWIVGKLGSRSLAAITLPSMGIFVIVTNCSDRYRHKDMAKIFKGLC